MPESFAGAVVPKSFSGMAITAVEGGTLVQTFCAGDLASASLLPGTKVYVEFPLFNSWTGEPVAAAELGGVYSVEINGSLRLF